MLNDDEADEKQDAKPYLSVEFETIITDDLRHEYRWRIRRNADFPDCIDVLHESWDNDTKTYVAQEVMSCLSNVVALALANALAEARGRSFK